MASINSLAERLMTDRPDFPNAGRGSPPINQDVEEALRNRPELALNGSEEAVALSPLDGVILESGPDSGMTAETCVELVNEMLIWQARRHGVDLS